MGSKAFLLLGVLVATFLLISWQVGARDLAETSTKKENAKTSTQKYGLDDTNGGTPAATYGTTPGLTPYGTKPTPYGTRPTPYGRYPGGGYGGYVPPPQH